MRDTVLDARLMSAAELVRQGAVFADIGTDHAHLPIFLLEAGRVERAVLSDVNEGPLAAALANVKEHGLCERVELVLTDGAAALSGKGITDYAVCGMGGELIARIVSDAPCMRESGVRLILQPMTRQAVLRTELARLGFSILREKYSYADGKYYVCILAEYTNDKKECDPIAAEIGTRPTDSSELSAYLGYLEAKLRATERARDGKLAGGGDAEAESKLSEALAEEINSLRRQTI